MMRTGEKKPEISFTGLIGIKLEGRKSLGFYDPAKVDIFNQAATETGLEVLVQPTEKTRWISKDRPNEPAVELVNSSGKDLSPFWGKVRELEEAAANKAG